MKKSFRFARPVNNMNKAKYDSSRAQLPGFKSNFLLVSYV